MFKKFFSAFPPPDFLNVPYAGIAISDNHVRCIQFGVGTGGLFVSKYTEKKLSPGIVVSGFIQNIQEVVHVLEEIKKEVGLQYVKVSLPEEKGYLFNAKVPKVENQELRGAIEFKMEENVPVSPSELLFDYMVTDTSAADRVHVVVSALPITVVDTYVQTFRDAGLSLLSLEIESQAIVRSLIAPHDTGTSLIIHFGKEKVGLYVAHNRVVHFTQTIMIKGEPTGDLSFLSQEIGKLYLYWHTLKDNAGVESRKISEIIVCGEDVRDDVVSHLSSSAKTRGTLGNVWTNVCDIHKTVPQIPFEESLRYSAAIGLALPSDILL